jgi:hypothetical protein
MAKKQWDKAVHATVLIDPALTQEIWHKHTDTIVAADPAAGDPEPRVYNPSGPHYDEPLVSGWPPPVAPQPDPPTGTAQKETKV